MADDKPRAVSSEQVEFSRRRFLRNASLATAAIPFFGSIAEILREQGAGAATYARNNDHPFFAAHPKYRFVMVNHVTTNSFFIATVFGIQDACALTRSSYTWTGSTNNSVSAMTAAINAAIRSKANGIGTSIIDNTAFDAPVDAALDAGIPIIAYNADTVPPYKNNRMAYVGQPNSEAGAAVAAEIVSHVKSGDKVAGIIATPGSTNLQPRLEGARPIFEKAGVNFVQVATSVAEGVPEYDKIAAWYASNKDVRFMMSVDGGDSDSLASFVQKNHLQGRIGACGWDVDTPVLEAVNRGTFTLTVDQQAYLQGFDTIMQLFLFNISGGLMRPTDTNTGIGIVTKATVTPHLKTTRWGGTSAAEGALKPPPRIPL